MTPLAEKLMRVYESLRHVPVPGCTFDMNSNTFEKLACSNLSLLESLASKPARKNSSEFSHLSAVKLGVKLLRLLDELDVVLKDCPSPKKRARRLKIKGADPDAVFDASARLRDQSVVPTSPQKVWRLSGGLDVGLTNMVPEASSTSTQPMVPVPMMTDTIKEVGLQVRAGYLQFQFRMHLFMQFMVTNLVPWSFVIAQVAFLSFLIYLVRSPWRAFRIIWNALCYLPGLVDSMFDYGFESVSILTPAAAAPAVPGSMGSWPAIVIAVFTTSFLAAAAPEGG